MSPPVSLPEGYVRVAEPGAWGFARTGAAAWGSAVLGSGATLHAWAAAREERKGLGGRGTAWAVPAPVPGGARAWVVRHYHRGGAAALWLGDRYLALGEPRPIAELRSSLEVARRGICTPGVVAGAVYRAGAFYRADLVTEEVPGGTDLGAILFEESEPDAQREASLRATGALVRRLAEAGVRHADLNAKNVVIEPGADGPRAWLVDLDRCAFPAGASDATCAAMRRRLERSLRKLEARSGRRLGAEAWRALDAGFASGVGQA